MTISAREFDLLERNLAAGSHFLIEAGAGTGKTHNIQHLYLRLVLERDLEPGQILAVTFTEAATAELRGRVATNLRAAVESLENTAIASGDLAAVIEAATAVIGVDEARRRARRALACLDEAAIFTIHGFCARVLSENAFESRSQFDLELLKNQKTLLRDIAADFCRRHLYAANPVFAAALAVYGFDAGQLAEFAERLAGRPDLAAQGGETMEFADGDLLRQLAELAAGIAAIAVNARTNQDVTTLVADMRGFEPSVLDAESAARLLARIEGLKGNNTVLKELVPTFRSAVLACVRRAFFEYFQTSGELAARKRTARQQSYDDMLLDLRAALRGADGSPNPDCALARGLRKRYRAAMIDEFQDTDPIQCEIFETVFRHPDCVFIMIGDPKQSIYRFRGADIYSYLAAMGGAGQETLTLTKNFRSTPEIIAGVNSLFGRPRPFWEQDIGYPAARAGRGEFPRRLFFPDGAAFQLDWVLADNPKGIGKGNFQDYAIAWTADRVVEALETFRWRSADGCESRLAPRDIAVLLVTNRQARSMRTQLKRRGVPAVIARSGNVFESAMAKELYYLLRATLNPANSKYLKTALGGGIFAFPEEKLLALGGVGTGAGGDELGYWTERFREYRGDWERRGVMPALTAMATFDNLHPACPAFASINPPPGAPPWRRGVENLAAAPLDADHADNRARHLADLRHLMELAHRSEAELALSPPLLLAWLRRMITDADARGGEDDVQETRLETDNEAVSIMTVHASKGLQFPLVYCPDLWGKGFAVKTNGGEWFCHPGGGNGNGGDGTVMPLDTASAEELAPRERRESLGELLRLVYVATTRAEHYCRLLYGNFNGVAAATAPHYLLRPELDDDFVDAKPGCVGDAPPELGDAIQTLPRREDEFVPAGVPIKYSPPADSAENLAARGLRAGFRVPKNWGIISYSSLGRHQGGGQPAVGRGTDEFFDPDAVAAPVSAESAPADSAALPGGSATGLCLHEIMEELDFCRVGGDSHESWSEEPALRGLIEGKMRHYGLLGGADDQRRGERYSAMCDVVHRILTTPLPEPANHAQAILNQIPAANRAAEIEFFMELSGRVDKNALRQLAAQQTLGGGNGGDVEGAAAPGLRFQGGEVDTGMLTGSIDLVFRHGERYYFLDWKTDRMSDYRPAAMRAKMFDAAYILQYLIYSLALDRHLRGSLRGYEFKHHFGGGYYAFVRGVAPDGRGIIHARLDEDDLAAAAACLGQGSARARE